MVQQTPITPADFFCNPAARDAGFSGQFWLDAYELYMDEVERDPSRSFDKWDVEHTVRLPFADGHVDVLVRSQPDGREYGALRFTVFPASDGPEPHQLDRWYWFGDDGEKVPPVLGEAVFLDYMHRW